jgi:AcrR family transcriptional regulator
MGSKERILPLKENTRRNILDKATCIIQSEGCDALTMRKLAEQIDYTPPMIYEYFNKKEAIFQELARKGYLKLAKQVEHAGLEHEDAPSRIAAMWKAYWEFAFSNQSVYQLMYGINVNCCPGTDNIPESDLVEKLMTPVIRSLYPKVSVPEEEVRMKFYTYWSVIHGLIALRIIHRGASSAIDHEILYEAINGITLSIRGEILPA